MATYRQKLVASKIVENRGNISKTMREVGYSSKTAKNPRNLTNSKGWRKLLTEYLPDEIIVRKHRELLEAKRIYRVRKKGKVVIETEELDAQSVGKALELAYKIKGYYSPKKDEVNQQITTVEIISYADTLKLTRPSENNANR